MLNEMQKYGIELSDEELSIAMEKLSDYGTLYGGCGSIVTRRYKCASITKH